MEVTTVGTCLAGVLLSHHMHLDSMALGKVKEALAKLEVAETTHLPRGLLANLAPLLPCCLISLAHLRSLKWWNDDFLVP